jgi:Holliday junction resolvase RusA-like endonuclease
VIRLEIIGIPAPQGSKTRFPNGAMVDGTSKTGRAKLIEWRRAVADAARAWLAEHPRNAIDGPVALRIAFRFPPTKSDPCRHLHTVTPDASKVLRATEDALVHAGLLKDDRLVCDLHVTKRWCEHGETAGATVDIEQLDGFEALQRERRKTEAAERRQAEKGAYA